MTETSERDREMALAIIVGIWGCTPADYTELDIAEAQAIIAAARAEGAAAERERCAKIADAAAAISYGPKQHVARSIATRIRSDQ